MSLFRMSHGAWIRRGSSTVLLIGLMAGCGKGEIRVYYAPKENSPIAAALPETPSPGSTHLHWSLPAGWNQLPASGMRAASFMVEDPNGQQAEIVVIPLPGLKGNEAEVVNLWRDQLGLAQIQPKELTRLGQQIQVGAEEASLFDLVSAEPRIENKFKAGILAAVLNRGQTTWFFKMSGESSLVRDQKPAFIEFLKSITFDESDHSTQVAAAPNLPPIGGSQRPNRGPDSSAKPDWQAPAGWQEQPAPPMALAGFVVPGKEGGQATVSVTMLPGAAGGVLANVNRWRGQLGLDPVGQPELQGLVGSLDVLGGKAIVIDMRSERASKRMVAAIVSRDSQTWFYKMLGDETVVAQEKEAFIQFVQTVRYPNG